MRSIFRTIRRPVKADTPLTYEESLRYDLLLAKWDLENAYAGFDYVTDPDLIDCYIYQLNAAMKRYKYLLEKYEGLKKETLSMDDARLAQLLTQNGPEHTLQPLAGI